MIQAASVTGSGRAGELRQEMAEGLIAEGWIASPRVEAAFRSVPRHLFTPAGTPLETSYDGHAAPVLKKAADGSNLSSVSGPWLQAKMIVQAGIGPGMRVLEIGSGGYNAALLAEVTGEHVVTVDIDPDITARASAALEAAGYAGRVTVVTADGEHGFADRAPYDAIVVTAAAWDLPPAWRDQVLPGGRLAVPLVMNTFTRTLGFRRAGDHWQSDSAQLAGFVLMQGIGQAPVRLFRLADPAGGHITLRLGDETDPENLALLDGALETEPVTVWSGITIAQGAGFEDLQLWLAGGFLPGFSRIDASDSQALPAADANKTWFGFGGILGDSFSVLAMRKTAIPGAEFEFGARAFGPHAAAAAQALTAQTAAWDARGRAIPADAFGYWPAGTGIPPLGDLTAVFRKRHGTVTVTWPPAA
jgi:protein-L-isoaspartate(D-aspartate) O-methyltransferase